MRIAFITNHDKTRCYQLVAERLEAGADGPEIFWISASPYWTRFLVGRGVERARILQTSEAVEAAARDRTPLDELPVDALRDLEVRCGLRINNLVLMDRLLRDRPYEFALRYLVHLERLVARFLAEHDIRVVFGEASQAMGLVTAQVCRAQGRAFLYPHTARHPDDQLLFFKGIYQTEFVRPRPVEEADLEWARAYLAHFREKRPRPIFSTFYRRPHWFHWRWIRLFVAHLIQRESRHDLTSSVFWLARRRVRHVWNLARLSMAHPFARRPGGRPFVLFAMHIEPEASADIFAAHHSHQLSLLRQIARAVPVTHDLYVKEHPVAVGTRPLADYRTLAAIPGVRLVDPFADSAALLARASIICTLSGTMAFEAGLLGIPAVVFSRVFFLDLPSVRYADSIVDLDHLFDELLDAGRPDDKSIVTFLATVYAASFPGFVDGYWNEDIENAENVERVAHAFRRILALPESAWRLAAPESGEF